MAGCFGLPLVDFCMIQAAGVIVTAGCWCLKAISFHQKNFFCISFNDAGLPFLFAMFCSSVCATLAAVCWCLRATGKHTISFPSFIHQAGCLLLFVTYCLRFESMCFCHPGGCLLVMNSYQFTQISMFKSDFMKLAGCLCVPDIVSQCFNMSVSLWQLSAGAKGIPVDTN